MPRLTLTVVAEPTMVPTPIDSFGLKYTTSLAFDVKYDVLTGIEK